MLRQSLLRSVPTASTLPRFTSLSPLPSLALQRRCFADTAPPAKRVKGAFMGKKDKDVHAQSPSNRHLCCHGGVMVGEGG